MADGKKEHDLDLENLRALKASLICSKCSRFPRPGTHIFSCPKCCKVACSNCVSSSSKCECIKEVECNHLESKGSNYVWTTKRIQDPINFYVEKNLTKFASVFKIHPCVFLKNGCKNEFDVKDLPALAAHEKVCVFRNITCPSINCTSSIVFNSIMDHYKKNHRNLKIKDELLDFNGNIETLKNDTFVLNSYGKPFFPQFYVNGNFLHIWIVGYTDDIAEASSYEAELCFYNGDGSRKGNICYDLVKDTKMDKFRAYTFRLYFVRGTFTPLHSTSYCCKRGPQNFN